VENLPEGDDILEAETCRGIKLLYFEAVFLTQ
jgi:hypothetical protein